MNMQVSFERAVHRAFVSNLDKLGALFLVWLLTQDLDLSLQSLDPHLFIQHMIAIFSVIAFLRTAIPCDPHTFS